MAATGTNTLATLNGLFKNVYSDKMENLIPDGVKLLNKIPFSKRDQIGLQFNQPVILGHEHGVSFSSGDVDAFSLADAVPGQIKNATVEGTQLVLRSVLGYTAVSRSMGSERAFKDATKYLVENMLSSVTKKLEIEMLYGQVGYARVDGVVTASTSVPIRAAEWAPGIWAGAEKMPVAFYDNDVAGSGTEVSGAGEAAGLEVSAVDFDTKTITLNSAVTLADGDYIFHKGAFGNEFAGVHRILTNTGTIFGISAATYTLWKGNSFSASSAALSFQKIQDAVARGVEKGLDSDVIVMVNPKTWADLLNDQAALRSYDSSFSPASAVNGAKEIKFHGQNGIIEIIPSIYVKEGYSYVLCLKDWARIGSTDVTFRRPGKGDEFFKDLENSAGYDLRAYCDAALFCKAIGRNILITDIVN